MTKILIVKLTHLKKKRRGAMKVHRSGRGKIMNLWNSWCYLSKEQKFSKIPKLTTAY